MMVCSLVVMFQLDDDGVGDVRSSLCVSIGGQCVLLARGTFGASRRVADRKGLVAYLLVSAQRCRREPRENPVLI
jgi:hypothetical protein